MIAAGRPASHLMHPALTSGAAPGRPHLVPRPHERKRGVHATVLLGLLVGLVDFVMDFLPMAVPRTELGWVADLVILAAATIAITVFGSRSAAASPPSP